MPQQSLRQTLLANIEAAKQDAVWGWYFNYLTPIIGDAFNDIFDQVSDDDSDMDVEPPSSDTFSDPLSDDTEHSSDSTASEETYQKVLQECLQFLDTLEDEVRVTRRLRQSVSIPRAPQIHLLDEWRLHNPDRFRDKLRVSPDVFDQLLDLIRAHPIFASSSARPQLTFSLPSS